MPILSQTSLISSPNLKGYYPLDSDGTDASGTGNTLTVTGAPTFSAAMFGNGPVIDASTKNLNKVGGSSGLPANLGDFSFSIWIKRLGAITATSSAPMLFGVVTDGNNLGGISAGASASTNIRGAAFSAGVGSNSTDLTLPISVWHHVVFTRSNAGVTFKMYLNGVLSTTDTVTARDIGTTVTVRICESYTTWNVQADDGAFFTRELSLSEIQEIYAGAQQGYSLVM